MSEDTTKTGTPSAASIAKGVMALFAMGLISFFCSQIWNMVDGAHDELIEMNDRVKELEADKSKWATLAELHNRMLQMEAQQQVMERVWEYEYDREIPDPTTRIGPRIGPRLGPLPADGPELVPIDPEEYKRLQEQKHQYPNEPRKK